jgi:hypothetical protein
MNLLMLREATASVALSHVEDCDCDACLATAGDKDAWHRIVLTTIAHATQAIGTDPRAKGRR